PQAPRLGDDQVIDIAVGDVVHGQRTGDGHHAHERQVADQVTVAHRAPPVLGGGGGTHAAGFDGRLATGQAEVASVACQDVGDEPGHAERRAHAAAAGRHPDEIAVHLVGGERIVE